MKQSQSPLKTESLKRQVIFLVILIVLSLSSLGFFSYIYIKSTNNFFQKTVELSLEKTKFEVDSWLMDKIKFVEHYTEAIGDVVGNKKKTQNLLLKIAKENKTIADIYFVTKKGSAEGGYILTAYWDTPESYNWTTRPWFKQIAQSSSGTAIISKPYKDERTGEIIVTITSKVKKKGKVVGYLAEDVLISKLNEIINSAKITPNSVLNILDMDWHYMTNRDISKVIEKKKYPGSEEAKFAFFSEDNFLQTKGFFLKTSLTRDIYFAVSPLYDTAWSTGWNTSWFIVGTGKLSDFHSTIRSIVTLALPLLALLAIFIVMLARSWKSYLQIEATNRNLEKIVEDRTSELKNILDNTGQGFFTFGSSMRVNPGYSKGCVDIFETEIKNATVPELLFGDSSETSEDMREGLNLLFKGKSNATVIFDFLEKRTIIKNKIISIDYKETTKGKVLCILTDITLAEELNEKNQVEWNRNTRIIRAIQHKFFFNQFVKKAEEIFSALDMTVESKDEMTTATDLKKLLHTLKGDAGFFNFNDTRESVHDAESALIDYTVMGTPYSKKDLSTNIKSDFYREMNTILDLLGENWLERAISVNVPRDIYLKIISYVSKNFPSELKLKKYLEYYRKVPIKELFVKLPLIATTTSSKLGKQIEPMTIKGGNLRVLPENYQGLSDACIHIVNNMVDHGIEYPYEREAIHKLSKGKISLTITADKSMLTLKFSDDGKGINTKDIEARARDMGIYDSNKSQESILNLIFEEGFSTKTESDLFSGRGMGMTILKAEVEKLGGKINIRSRIGQGTVFEINIPLGKKI